MTAPTDAERAREMAGDPMGEMLENAMKDAADGVPIDLPPPADDAAAIEASLNVWLTMDGNNKDIVRAMIAVYHKSRFGGDPAEMLKGTHAEWTEENKKVEQQSARIAELEAEVRRLRSGINALVNCQSPLTRSAMREGAAEILNNTVSLTDDQSPFVTRISELKAENATLCATVTPFVVLASLCEKLDDETLITVRLRIIRTAARAALQPKDEVKS